jgi:predicted acylesterase/phospholipase RssA
MAIPSDRTFELGLVMAGAISAGAYSAGVLDFFFEALDAYEQEKTGTGWTGPTHDVRVPIMTGASAGGMTSSICALHAFHELEHVWPGKPLPPPQKNRLYSSWVTDISLDALLETSDLDGESGKGLKSLLCCDVLDRIVKSAFDLSPNILRRNWIGRIGDPSLRVMITLTNLRGVPYSFPLFGSQSAETYGMLSHADYFDYKIGVGPVSEGVPYLLDIRDTTTVQWNVFRTTALATGAFPVGLAPRVVQRPTADFYRTAGTVDYEDPATGQYVIVQPDHSFGEETPYSFISVDGGVIDNAPLELARRYLAGAALRNNPNGEKADKAVLLVAPFPNFAHAPQPDSDDRLIHILPSILATLIDQARFKPDELQKAADDTYFSRFMISPTRQNNGSAEAATFPIASGVLGGFGGFLHQSFRHHDYLLGRRNAQAFLRWNFGLPASNPLFQGVRIDEERWHVRDAEAMVDSVPADAQLALPKKQFATTVGGPKLEPGFPIIPLVDRLCEPIEIGHGDLPRPQDLNLDTLRASINSRAQRVVATLVDIDLRNETDKMGVLAPVVREGARAFGQQIITEKAVATISEAIEQVKRAFA